MALGGWGTLKIPMTDLQGWLMVFLMFFSVVQRHGLVAACAAIEYICGRLWSVSNRATVDIAIVGPEQGLSYQHKID